ncbi:putative LPS assembly protein LptD [Microbacter margulisiae]|uniref:Lipopolysaccharide assembly outer membrane protein LptD (OstA) n=1 Tax=Microbacter margulisiae TaxID=1350067 RepID=A0A7W5H3P3_9PORP|nr:putative LPS assembly protein LptD [Microbacter margulisiae]MBB3188567.1 lipopolysaccharide assembly outer membrane protein LptD (OstA) [Microbacter margulisiae]
MHDQLLLYSRGMRRNNTFTIKFLYALIWVMVLSGVALPAYAQKTKHAAKDTLTTKNVQDTTTVKSKGTQNKSQLTDKIVYQANDSIVFYGDGTGMMYGNGDIQYQKMELKANYIRMKMDSSLVYAMGTKDSTGQLVGEPSFKDESNQFDAKELTYNFKTKRGFIHHTVTQQGEGYIVSDLTKLTSDKTFYMSNMQYTTCDHTDHPDYYIQLTRAKVKPQKYIVSGPAYLVIEDVPLPLALPFGYFPFTSKYSSGIIVPSYGDDFTRGFYLHNGGYYFALNDYMDLALTGEIYTKGTWAVNAISTYVKRYKYRGSLNFSYRQDITSEKGMPDYGKSTNMSIQWTHSQDSKASLYSTLSGSVNFSTSGYNRSNINNVYDPTLMSQNTKSSSINFSQRFPNSPFTLSANANITQRTADSTINMQLPNLTVTMSQIHPFKRANTVGPEKWYDKIVMSYSGSFANSIQTKENKLLHSSFSRDWQNGFDHQIPVSATFNLFKYISITPAVNYEERWYFKSVQQRWNSNTQSVIRDTTSGFYRSYNFNASVTANTTIYGFFIPNRKIFGDKIDRIRHVFKPSISFTYNPDFSNPIWGSYKTYDKYVQDSQDPQRMDKETVLYSPFEGGIYGYPAAGKSGAIGYSFSNNVEMKVKEKSDTTDQPVYKVVSLIDNFSWSGSYNLATDSLRWSLINANLRLKLPFSKSYTLNLSGTFDPYLYGLDANKNPVHINQLRWAHGKFPRFMGTNFSQSFTISDQTFKHNSSGNKENTNQEQPSQQTTLMNNTDIPSLYNAQQDTVKKQTKPSSSEVDADGYEKPQFHWSLSFNYSLLYGQSSIFNYHTMEYGMQWTQNLSLNGTISPTPKWNINWSASYSFANKQFTQINIGITRDLHCWSMSAQLVPVGYYTSYMVRIAVKSSLLEGLKYQKSSSFQDNVNWE